MSSDTLMWIAVGLWVMVPIVTIFYLLNRYD